MKKLLEFRSHVALLACSMALCGARAQTACDSLNAFLSWSQNNNTVYFNGYANSWALQQVTTEWTFGDGSVQTSTFSPTHQYALPGAYIACLTVSGFDPLALDTCMVTVCDTVYISSIGIFPCDSLTADFTGVAGGLGVNFQNAVVDPLVNYSWTFGDGATGSGPNPYHAYAQAGVYTACCIVWAWDAQLQDTCWADHCEQVSVLGAGSTDCDTTFTNSFAALYQGANTFLFEGSDNGNATWHWWDLGDGTQSTGDPVQHTYAQPGQYIVCYTAGYYNALAQDTCTSTTCQMVTIQGPVDPCDSLLEAFFTPMGMGGNAWTFNNGTYSADPNNTTFLWSFGDGTTSTDPIPPLHAYQDSGLHIVCLTATLAWQGDTCIDTWCDSIEVVFVTAIDEPLQGNGLWAAPMPFDELLTVSGDDLTGEVEAMLFDLSGRTVARQALLGQGLLRLKFPNLASGTYLLTVESPNDIRVLRVMKR